MGKTIQISLDFDSVDGETDLGILVNLGDLRVWFPKSQTSLIYDNNETSGVVTMPEWLAFEKGLI